MFQRPGIFVIFRLQLRQQLGLNVPVHLQLCVEYMISYPARMIAFYSEAARVYVCDVIPSSPDPFNRPQNYRISCMARARCNLIIDYLHHKTCASIGAA
jgi:hypothetical protein